MTREIHVGAAQLGPIARDESRSQVVDRLIVLFPTDSDDVLFSHTATEQGIIDYIHRLGDEVVGKL